MFVTPGVALKDCSAPSPVKLTGSGSDLTLLEELEGDFERMASLIPLPLNLMAGALT